MMPDEGEFLNGRFVAWSGRQWAVTEEGLECLDGSYFIDARRVLEDIPDWSFAEQVAGKNWVDLDDFVTAWMVAIALHSHPKSEQIHEAINNARMLRHIEFKAVKEHA